jgi:uncharacterized protein YgiM (DUF1202 family)
MKHPAQSSSRRIARLSVIGLLLAGVVLSACDSLLSGNTSTPVFTPTPLVPPSLTPLPTITPTLPPTPTPTATPLPTPMALVVSVAAEDKLRLYKEPDASSDVVGALSPGIFVPLVDMTEDGMWLKIGLDPIGWTPATKVTLNGSLLFSDQSAPKRQPLLQADAPVNVRTGPGTNYGVLGQLKAGQVVRVLGRNETGSWVQIPFKGTKGWVAYETVIIAGIEPTATPLVTEEVTREP